LTEDLSVHSLISILLLLFFCSNISVKTAVNSICLRTCLIFFFHSSIHLTCLSKRVQSNKLFTLTSFFLVYLKINFQLLSLLFVII
jgi:hypothetical protein